LELYALVIDPPKTFQREDLKPTRVGENGT
jgi:hypothetical protein